MSYRAKYAALLEEIVDQADALAMRFYKSGQLGAERKHDGTVVTQADKGIEQMAIAQVKASGLAMDVVGEETTGEVPKGPATNGRARMIIDPIDGTEEFTRGIPTFGTLMGIEEEGEIVAGMVSAPALGNGTRWFAYRGDGAWRKHERLQVSRITRLSEAMIFTTGTGPRKDTDARERMRKVADASRNSRSIGGFWQHMLVAEGAIECAIDWLSKPWDLSPLGIIVEEAGGKATTVDGERTIYKGRFVSTNGLVHEEVLNLLR